LVDQKDSKAPDWFTRERRVPVGGAHMSYESDKIAEMKEDMEVIVEKLDSLFELTMMIAKKLGVGERSDKS